MKLKQTLAILPLFFIQILHGQIFTGPEVLLEDLEIQFLTDAFAKGDINQDGLVDFANSTGIYFNAGNGMYNFTPLDINSKIYGVVDMDNDGDMDMVTARSILENDGANNFEQVFIPLDGGGVQEIVNFGDFNNDGLTDLVMVDLITFYDDVLNILYNDGDLMFTQDPIDNAFDNGFIRVADYDGDGDDDIVSLLKTFGGGVSGILLYKNVLGSALIRSLVPVANSFSDNFVDLTDMDNDGDLDIVYSGSFASLHWIRNENGNYNAVTVIDSNVEAYWLDVEDINEDGSPDIVVVDTRNDPYDLGYFLNDGLGNMGEITTFGTLTAFNSIIWQWPNSIEGMIQLQDMNEDNLPDVVVTDILTDKLEIYMNEFMPSAVHEASTLVNHTFAPNPVNEIFNIEFTEDFSKEIAVEIYSSDALLVKQMEFGRVQKLQLNCSDLQAGLYYYIVLGNKSHELLGRGKLIKN